jgi:DNA-binding MarR family transcriptional regulator
MDTMSTWRGRMDVKVEVELRSSPKEVDEEDMSLAAACLTNDQDSIAVFIIEDKLDTIVAEFTINKARQMDVVERIGRMFRDGVRNYSQLAISFPKAASRETLQRKGRYTHKQGQYLAFIYHYTKLNRRPPAEADMQRFFKTTPPTVHNMVVQLEKKRFITKEPGQPRSIRLLLSRADLPELE